MTTKLADISADSPCCGVCKLDTNGQFCMGCFRTRADIGAWSMASDMEKREINLRAKSLAERISSDLKNR